MTFKLHQIHIRPGLRPIRTLASSPHSLISWEPGTSGEEGRQDERLPRAPQTLAPPLHIHYFFFYNIIGISFLLLRFLRLNFSGCQSSGYSWSCSFGDECAENCSGKCTQLVNDVRPSCEMRDLQSRN